MPIRLADVTEEQVRQGANWKLLNPGERFSGGRPEVFELDAAPVLREDDYVVYSAVQVTDSGKVHAMLLMKRVGDTEYGGDYFLLVNRKWKRVGAEPDPNAEFSDEYVANPLPNDPSFDSADDALRTLYRTQFTNWAAKI